MVDVLVIGLDGISGDLVDGWMDTGDLPVLASLRQRGIVGQLKSVVPPITVPAWFSFATGMNPGRFGAFDRPVIEPTERDGSRFAGFDERLVNATNIDEPFVWNWLGAHGRTASAIGVPSMYPAYGHPGVRLLSGPAIGGSYWAHPESLKGRVADLVDNYATSGTPDLINGSPDQIEKEMKQHSERVHRITLDEIDDRNPDFLQTVFMSTDWGGHAFWPDENDPIESNGRLKRHYQWVDGKVGELLDSVDEDTDVIIVSDHGMGPIYDRFRLNDWLIQEEYLQLASDRRPVLNRLGLTRERASKLLSWLPGGERIRQRLPRSIKKQVANEDPRVNNLDVNWTETTAFGHGEIGQIFVDVECDYEAIRDHLIENLVDFMASEGIEVDVFKKEKVYEGTADNLERAPDITFILHDFAYDVKNGYGGEGELWTRGGRSDSHQPIGGGHRLNGVFMGAGPSFDTGNRDAKLVDIVPTILHVMGEPIPQRTDGEVLGDVLTVDRSPEYEDATDRSWTDHVEVEKDDGDRRDQLEALGYLE